MHEYFLRPEVVRVALVVGIVASILFYERVQLTTGGAIVPAYLAMFLAAPLFIAVTLLAGLLTYVLVSVVIAKRWILYGRRKFEIEMLVGLVIVSIGTVVAENVSGRHVSLAALTGIGFLIPAVLAHDMFRQRPSRTLLAVGATTAIVALFIFTFASLLEISPLKDDLRPLPEIAGATGYPIRLIVVGVIASVLVGMLTFAHLGLRSGGFVTGAYLALVLPRALDLLFAAGVAVVTWFVVTKLVMPRLLIFGRRKLSTMLLVGAIVAWAGEIAITIATGGAYVPWKGFVIMTLMIPALLANDAQRQGLERTAWGAAITTLGVYGSLNVFSAGLVAFNLA
jgi:poly-gamma-glutamate biosynthesis protein PgsC/CapC